MPLERSSPHNALVLTRSEHDYVQFSFDATSSELCASFDDLPTDTYCPGRTRRFSQYMLRFEAGRWRLGCLPHRPHVQATSFNRHVGGVLRHYEPIALDVAALVDQVARHVGLARNEAQQVDVHQWRTLCSSDRASISVPEGPHRDGHRFGAILVTERHNVRGGITQFAREPRGEPFAQFQIDAGQGVCFDDERVVHFTTELEADGAAGETRDGWRDVLIFLFNHWRERKYGPAFERAATQTVVG